MIPRGHFETSSQEATEALAREIGAGLDGPAAFLLTGDLGAGKTAFARGLAEGLGVDPEDVSSPSFALVNTYRGGRLPLHHLDLYRLDEATAEAAAYDLGLEEMFEERAVVVVEWAERLGAFPVVGAVRVRIELDETDPDRRTVTIE